MRDYDYFAELAFLALVALYPGTPKTRIDETYNIKPATLKDCLQQLGLMDLVQIYVKYARVWLYSIIYYANTKYAITIHAW